MKLRCLFILSMFTALFAFADSGRIVIKQKSGAETIIELSNKPVITFSNENMTITSDIETVVVPLDDIGDYQVSNETTSIELPQSDAQYSEGKVTFNGLAEGAPVNVYAMDGKLIKRILTEKSTKATVMLQDLPKGTFIISAGNSRIKIVNK